MSLAPGDLVALLAAQLLPKTGRSQKAIDKAVQEAVKIVAAAHAAIPAPKAPPARGYTGHSHGSA
jgi:hypothetical protein